jgi:hypothetical protein
MKDELKAGQLITVPRGGLEGTVVILLDVGLNTEHLTPKNQIWNSYIVFSPSAYWGQGERIGLRGCDLMKW